MVWSRVALAVAVLSACLLSAVPAAGAAAPEGFLLLGEDAIEDAELNGVPMLDTWIDINGLAVATVGTDLVFHLGLQGTTTEAGSYCWMAGFTFGGDKYVGLDCYEGVAYESSNAASGVRPASTSRGTNVASSVTFDAAGAVITIPLSAISANVGDTITDIYGLTYATRALVAVDTVPDARMDSTTTESLGSYVIGGGSPAGAGPEVITQTLDTPHVQHDFANATSVTYVLNATIAWANATVHLAANVTVGSANVTIQRGNDTLLSALLTNATGPLPNVTALTQAAGNWTITIAYEGFAGRLNLTVLETSRSSTTATGATPGTATKAGSGSASSSGSAGPIGTDSESSEEQDVPAPGLLALGLVLVAFAVLRRRA